MKSVSGLLMLLVAAQVAQGYVMAKREHAAGPDPGRLDSARAEHRPSPPPHVSEEIEIAEHRSTERSDANEGVKEMMTAVARDIIENVVYKRLFLKDNVDSTVKRKQRSKRSIIFYDIPPTTTLCPPSQIRVDSKCMSISK
ncbi:hypothetical protein EVAR_80068_1 [Eumeta japonica]|uniref:Uncharacterized protein n=1 Tax=Eumeta variegata TaxID=151549 RepID=A0A4C1UCP0_EUMVA|nr:hypothetical protein EVAR_80068_1 [Eumeta japonica]